MESLNHTKILLVGFCTVESGLWHSQLLSHFFNRKTNFSSCVSILLLQTEKLLRYSCIFAELHILIYLSDWFFWGVRTVKVIKLISKDSIEDCILQLGQKKLKLEQDMTAAEQGKEMCTHSLVCECIHFITVIHSYDWLHYTIQINTRGRFLPKGKCSHELNVLLK